MAGNGEFTAVDLNTLYAQLFRIEQRSELLTQIPKSFSEITQSDYVCILVLDITKTRYVRLCEWPISDYDLEIDINEAEDMGSPFVYLLWKHVNSQTSKKHPYLQAIKNHYFPLHYLFDLTVIYDEAGQDDYPAYVCCLFNDIQNPVCNMGLAQGFIKNSISFYNTLQKLEISLSQNEHYNQSIDILEKKNNLAKLGQGNEHRLVGTSCITEQLKNQISHYAPSDISVLITGETGTGKGLVAQMIHEQSNRNAHNFIQLNCGLLDSQLIQSTLFGHKKGSFTGADNTTDGLVLKAQGGTLFLDEIAEIPLDMQSKLLTLLEEKTYRRVGDTEEYKADFRVVAASNQDLQDRVVRGAFRADLLNRLSVATIHVPPLRERSDDIPSLAQYFLKKQNPKLKLSKSALELLSKLEFDANVRGLRSFIMKLALIHKPDNIIRVPDISGLYKSENIHTTDYNVVHEPKKFYENLYKKHAGNRAAIGKELNISRSTVYLKLLKYGIISKRK